MGANGQSVQADLDALQASEIAYRREVEDVSAQRQKAAEGIVQEADTQGQARIQRAQDFAHAQQPFTETAPRDQINTVMQGAPWLFALAALGGKASKVNGLAMLEGLNGVSGGLIKGDEEALNASWTRYNAAFDKWKLNADQQERIYTELEKAYGTAGDAKLRAFEAALHITNDNLGLKLQVDDPQRLFDMRQKIIDNHLKLQTWKEDRELRRLQMLNLESEIEARTKKEKEQGARSEQQLARVGTSSDEAVQAISNIMKLPIASSTGWLGRSPPTGIFSATKSGLANKLTSQDVQDYQAVSIGIERNLAAIEAVGAATGMVGLTHLMEGIRIAPGDTVLTKLRKMAEARQVVEYGTKFFLDDPRVPAPLKQHILENIEKLKRAVPFTHEDITALEQAKNPQTTLTDVMKAKGLGTDGGSVAAAQHAKDKSGRPIVWKGDHWEYEANAGLQ